MTTAEKKPEWVLWIALAPLFGLAIGTAIALVIAIPMMVINDIHACH